MVGPAPPPPDVAAAGAVARVEEVTDAGIAVDGAVAGVLAAEAGEAAGFGAATCAAIVFCLLTIHN